MPVLGTAWQGLAPCQAWWFSVVPARLCAPPRPPAPSISPCLCLKFNWPFVPPHSEWAQAGPTNSQTRARIPLYLICPVVSLCTQPPIALFFFLSSTPLKIHPPLSLVMSLCWQREGAVEVMYFTKLFFPPLSSSCSFSLWWLAFICACSACL